MRIREALKHTNPSDQDPHFHAFSRISNTGKKAEGPGEESLLVEDELVLGGRHESSPRVRPCVDRVDGDRRHSLLHLEIHKMD